MDPVLVDRPEAAVTRITLNRPDSRNALSHELREALMVATAEAVADDECRVVVITGDDRAFCAGGDIKSMHDLDVVRARARLKRAHLLLRTIAGADKPFVAAVRGYAMGAGAGLATICDTVVAGESARIGFPFFKVGLLADWGLHATLVQRVGAARARHLLFYAQTLTAKQAHAIALVDEVVADENVAAVALERAAQLAALPAHALALSRQMLGQMPLAFETALEMEAMAQASCFQTDDAREGRAAFIDKRSPKFGRGGDD